MDSEDIGRALGSLGGAQGLRRQTGPCACQVLACGFIGAGPDTLKDETVLLSLPGPKTGICVFYHFSDGAQQS